MSKHGQGPRLLGRFVEGHVEEFIHARFVFSIHFFLKMFFLEIFTLSAVDLRDPEISYLIVAKLREFQTLDMPGPKIMILWDIMRNWLSEAKLLCSVKDIKKFGLDTLEEEINMLEKEFSQGSQELGFCHNDLQYSSIMIDEETRSITIIVSFLCHYAILCV
ncbi:hypothetical protein UlMin_038841 [Ulmus minor]